MKKWEKGFSGICAFLLVMALSLTAFADVKAVGIEEVVSSETPLQNRANENGRA